MLRHRLAAVLCVLLLPGTALAQRPMTIVDLISIPVVSAPQLSPDGTQVVYVQADADWSANKRISHLWRARTGGTEVVQLTFGTDNETEPRWSPDGQHVVFIGKRNGAEVSQVYLLSMGGGEARALTSHAAAVSAPAWAPDGASVYFLAVDAKPETQTAREKAKDDVYAFDENFQQRHLWKVAVASMAETRVTSGDYSVLSYDLSSDGTKIAHHRAPSPNFGDNDRGEVWVMDAAGANAVALTKNTVPESGASVSPDGSMVLFLSQANDRFEIYYNANLFVVPASGGTARELTRDIGHELTDAAWSRDGRAIYARQGRQRARRRAIGSRVDLGFALR